MKKVLKKVGLVILVLLAVATISGLILAYLPVPSRVSNKGITPIQAAALRTTYKEPHHQFTTTDGEVLFLRRWNPDTLSPEKKDIAVLILHGVTAHSGAYDMAGKPISEGGYTVFGLDYRGHGLSDGNRGDSPGKDRWVADMTEAVQHIKGLGFSKIILLGHSLGVAAAMVTADAIPQELFGLILLSGAYEGRKGLSKPVPFMKKITILSSSIFRPNHQAIEYYREGMNVTKDTLFNFRYTLRFMTMLDVNQLRIPAHMNAPILVGMGDQDELFSLEKAREFYDLIPGNNKSFLVMKNTTHAGIPRESWDQVVGWLDNNFP